MKGLVLEGGGIKGSYQIGAFYAFKKCGIKIDGFAGTSIGAFNAAMLASHKELDLLDYWYNLKPGELFDFNKDFVKASNDGDWDLDALMGAFDTFKNIVSNNGIDNAKMLDSVKDLINYDDLKYSDKDFGLVTVKVKGFEPQYIYKEDIEDNDQLIEYLMASCYLPIFKEKKIIDDNYYIDGGFFDNSPTRLLIDKGYKKIYVIAIKGIGISIKARNGDADVTYITPSRDNGHILELNQEVIRDNIMMGYYDTLRVIRNYDGYKYLFKRRSHGYYDFLVRNVDRKLKKRVRAYFNAKTNKELVLKALEYLMEKDHVNYYDLYNAHRMIRKYRHSIGNFINDFIAQVRFF